MENHSDDFFDSLDITDDALLPFIPTILEDLWELGSMPEYIVKLVHQYVPLNATKKVADLGCGKGAVLIQLHETINFKGLGIDIIPEFIEEANSRALHLNKTQYLDFQTKDIKQFVKKQQGFNLVIYGHDSDIFGDVSQTLKHLEKSVINNEYLILETTYAINPVDDLSNKSELYQQINNSDFSIIDQIAWEKSKIIKANAHNTQHIQKAISKLSELHPDKKTLFDEYLKEQEEECHALENDIQCVTILLQKHS